MFGGVSKSGSPTDRLTMSRPAAFNSVASAVIAIVGDGFTRARRSARKDMTLQHPKMARKHPNIRGLSCEPYCRLEGCLLVTASARRQSGCRRHVFADIPKTKQRRGLALPAATLGF